MRFINDARSSSKEKAADGSRRQNNVEFKDFAKPASASSYKNLNVVSVVAKVNIPPNSELFIDYGSNYKRF